MGHNYLPKLVDKLNEKVLPPQPYFYWTSFKNRRACTLHAASVLLHRPGKLLKKILHYFSMAIGHVYGFSSKETMTVQFENYSQLGLTNTQVFFNKGSHNPNDFTIQLEVNVKLVITHTFKFFCFYIKKKRTFYL